MLQNHNFLLNDFPITIIELDEAYTISFINKIGYTLFGNNKNIVGSSLLELLCHDDNFGNENSCVETAFTLLAENNNNTVDEVRSSDFYIKRKHGNVPIHLILKSYKND